MLLQVRYLIPACRVFPLRVLNLGANPNLATTATAATTMTATATS